ncbi:MAG: hypothetical protein HLUCCA12_06715 [Rhodobacteraceae bacterium HLUCCA12]|nr:MAG: hypothetical protein HLUCCA12_06715 [Rhodobacteraceae bacterium HLUCCA12]
MRALIHIGMPKTGSSTIQSFLKINSIALRKQGIRHDPVNRRFGSQYEIAATGLVRAGGLMRDDVALRVLGLRDAAAQRAYVDAWEARLRDGLRTWSEGLFIGSSEHIHAWLTRPEQISALDDTLQQYFEEVRYLVYLRPQVEMVVSTYSERIRRGDTLDFDAHFNSPLRALNYWKSMRLWAGVVGEDRITPRLLTPDALHGGDLLDDFCAVAGIERTGLKTPARMNTSLSAEAIALRRWLNRFLNVRNRAGKRAKPYKMALRLLETRLPKPGTRLQLSDDQRRKILADHAESNEKLRKRYFPDRDMLFPERPCKARRP